MGPFPQVTDNRRFVIVAMDYFTKWIKAEALANIQDVDAKKFIWKNIINIFEVPETLIQTMDYNSTVRLSRHTATIWGSRTDTPP